MKFKRHLGAFGITNAMQKRPCRQLSGGQKSRIALATITWKEPHIIVMDEPTNHLDMETIEALVSALNGFSGGVVLVSHDVHFVGSICSQIYVVENQGVTEFMGDIMAYKKSVIQRVIHDAEAKRKAKIAKAKDAQAKDTQARV